LSFCVIQEKKARIVRALEIEREGTMQENNIDKNREIRLNSFIMRLHEAL